MLDKSKLTPLPKDDNLTSKTTNAVKNISSQEIARFDALAESWWDPNGKYKTALLFNQARISFFIPEICRHFGRDPSADKPLDGLTILDVGSGGGLVCEPLAKAGAQVLGIDASEMSIEVAKRHAASQNLDIEYRHMLSTDLVEQAQHFDVVINAEVVEHVPDQTVLIQECCDLVNTKGLLVLATLNRTVKSWVIAILGAEYVMRYLPIGTHDWKMFVTPRELEQMAGLRGFHKISESGMMYNPITRKWSLNKDTSVNYIQCYKK